MTSQDKKFITELEAIQSPSTGTFVSCSMQRKGHFVTHEDKILIHRSTDNVASWSLMETFLPQTDGRLIDPVITVDPSGVFYVIFMNIEDMSIPMSQRNTSLDLYKSIDDGLTWQFVGAAYEDKFPDYPQLITRQNGDLFLTFGNYIATGVQEINFMHSSDGGQTWSAPIVFPDPIPTALSTGIPDFNWGSDSSIHLGFGSAAYSGPCHVVSNDFGLTWSGYTFANQSTNATVSALNKIVSHPTVDYFGILCLRPHSIDHPLTYHYLDGNEFGTTYLDTAAYAEGIMTDDSIIHVTYNAWEEDSFKLNYIASSDQGLTFTAPISLYSGIAEIHEAGEYQSFILGQDGQFYLTFCDWSDSSIAKTIVFDPLLLDYEPTLRLNQLRIDRAYTISPNPTKTSATIQIPENVHLTGITICTLNGSIIDELQPEANSKTFNLPCTSYPPGTYIVRFQENERYVLRRLIIH